MNAAHPAAPQSSSRASEAELRQKRAHKQSEVRQVRSQIRKLKIKQRAVTVRLQGSQQRMESATRELHRVSRHLHTTLRSLEDTRAELKRLKGQLNLHLEQLTDLLVAYYRNGRTAYVQVLLTSDDMNQFLRRKEMVERIAQSDNELIRNVELEQTMVRDREAQLERKKQEAEDLRRQMAEKRRQYSEAAQEQRQLLTEITHRRAAYEQYLAELEQSSREIERLIRRLAAERKRQARPQNPNLQWKGTFIRPVGGSVTSGFGYRTHPIFRIRKMHTGVDLSASYGTSIKAAGDGVVIFSGWKRGYGKTVVVDHGGDLATLYAHCSSLRVSVGDSVSQGQSIAQVGSTGYSTGPHLHFEVRRSGVPVNPMHQ